VRLHPAAVTALAIGPRAQAGMVATRAAMAAVSIGAAAEDVPVLEVASDDAPDDTLVAKDDEFEPTEAIEEVTLPLAVDIELEGTLVGELPPEFVTEYIPGP
jgi:hypothetical protein